MDPDFNKVARPYDFISRLVFGNSLVEAQISSLPAILPNSHILIVGGGTGWILEEITKIHSSGLKISYVENSSVMIKLSKKRNWKQNKVVFFHQSIQDFHMNKPFDVIITPFFFDLFKREKVEMLFFDLDKKLNKDGLWLYTDFIPEKYQNRLWQKALLKTMYFFFGHTSKVEARELIDMDLYFTKVYTKISENWFYGRFLRAVVYQKL
jgi:cyclopropane fatty-acyl-phospholipid synthase-like methyltransferase